MEWSHKILALRLRPLVKRAKIALIPDEHSTRWPLLNAYQFFLVFFSFWYPRERGLFHYYSLTEIESISDHYNEAVSLKCKYFMLYMTYKLLTSLYFTLEGFWNLPFLGGAELYYDYFSTLKKHLHIKKPKHHFVFSFFSEFTSFANNCTIHLSLSS